MKDIEINSDKYTVLKVIVFLALALLVLISDLYALARHRIALPDIQFWEYPAAIISVYAAVLVYRDTNRRKNYPYGVTGFCLLALVLLLRIAAHWAGGSPRAQNLGVTIMPIIGIAASGLILVEGVRWFKKRVRLA